MPQVVHPNGASRNVGVAAIKRIAPCTTKGGKTTCPGVYKFGVCVRCPWPVFRGTLQKQAESSELKSFAKTCLPKAFERINTAPVVTHRRRSQKSFKTRVKRAYQCDESDQLAFQDFMKAF